MSSFVELLVEFFTKLFHWRLFLMRNHGFLRAAVRFCCLIGTGVLGTCFIYAETVIHADVTAPVAAETQEFDVVIYGGTSSAVVAAVQTKKMGKSVVLVSPDRHLGGLSSGGLGFTDSGNTGTVGGLAREFYRRVYTEYQKGSAWKWQKIEEYANEGQGTRAMLHEDRTMWIFEPHVAENVFDAWVAEMEIPLYREERLDRENGVEKDGTAIRAISMLSGKRFVGRVFIDATYEGDLMASAGVSYTLGREANSVYGEKWNGNQVGILHHGHWFKTNISPYRIPGDPESGLCRFVDDSEPGTRGEGDTRIQAYCYRLCMTDCPENRIPFTKPENYDPENYELLRRVLGSGWRELFHKFDRIPNWKTDTNNHGPFSMDFIGQNYDYPEASYERREEICREHRDYQMGLLYFLANDPGVPEDVREKMSCWGLAKDEFPETNGWPHQIYVREARRMVGLYVVTEHDCFGKTPVEAQGVPAGSVGMGSYTLDSHNVRRYVKEVGFVQNEGDIGVHPHSPYHIDYHALTPKREECSNLLVPVCVSSSHIAFGSIRMEPVFMILGQSAATAACMTLDAQCAVQDLSYEALAKQLKEDAQILEYARPAARDSADGIPEKKITGIYCSEKHAKLEGNWERGWTKGPFVGDGYLHDGGTGCGTKKAVYSLSVPRSGLYEVRLVYAPHANRAENVPVEIHAADGVKTVLVDQKRSASAPFQTLGTFRFEAGENAVKIVISNRKTNGHVLLDGVQLLAE